MTKKAIFIPLAALIVVGLLTFAGCKRHGHHKGAEFMVDYVSEVLDLTDAQRADLDQIKAEFMAKAEQMHADKDAMKADIMAQLEKEEMDADELKRIAALHRARMDAFIDLGIDRLLEIQREVLGDLFPKLTRKA